MECGNNALKIHKNSINNLDEIKKNLTIDEFIVTNNNKIQISSNSANNQINKLTSSNFNCNNNATIKNPNLKLNENSIIKDFSSSSKKNNNNLLNYFNLDNSNKKDLNFKYENKPLLEINDKKKANLDKSNNKSLLNDEEINALLAEFEDREKENYELDKNLLVKKNLYANENAITNTNTNTNNNMKIDVNDNNNDNIIKLDSFNNAAIKSELSEDIDWNEIDLSDIIKEENQSNALFNNFENTHNINKHLNDNFNSKNNINSSIDNNSNCFKSLNILNNNNKNNATNVNSKNGIKITNTINIINNINYLPQPYEFKNSLITNENIYNVNNSNNTNNDINTNKSNSMNNLNFKITAENNKNQCNIDICEETAFSNFRNSPKENKKEIPNLKKEEEIQEEEIDTENFINQLKKLKEKSVLDKLFEKYNIAINIKKEENKLECPVCFEKENKYKK